MDTTRRIRLPDGRTLAVDDVGDRSGVPVVYLHGTPDSRLARHPDDDIARACGVRLLAVDRPGAGDSDPHPGGDLTAIGHDLGHLLDALALERAALLGWSAGGLFALASASVLGPRAAGVLLVGTLPPVEAYADPAVLGALGPRRRPFVELATEVPPAELAAELAPHLVPVPLTAELAADHVLEGAGERGRAELGSVAGAVAQMARALGASVAQGLAGLERDIALQLEPGLDLGSVTSRVLSLHGAFDEVSPPAVGAWLTAHLPDATTEVIPDAGHHLVFPRWAELLTRARQMVGGISPVREGRC